MPHFSLLEHGATLGKESNPIAGWLKCHLCVAVTQSRATAMHKAHTGIQGSQSLTASPCTSLQSKPGDKAFQSGSSSLNETVFIFSQMLFW